MLARHFPAPRFVWLRRTDTEAQARSWARALDTDVWGQWQPSAADDQPWREDPTRVAELAAVIREHDAAWERWFAAEGIAPVTVAFEELVADPHGVAGGVLAALGLEHQGLTVLTAPTGAAR